MNGGTDVPAEVAVLDANGTIVAANEAWNRRIDEGLVPLCRDARPGTNFLERCRDAAAEGLSEAQTVVEGVQAVLSGTHAHFDLEYTPLAGPAPRWFFLSAMGLAGEGGGAIISHAEVTERKRAERERAELRNRAEEAEARYRALFEHAPDAILVADADARYVDANPAASELLGYTRVELLQMRVADVIPRGPQWTEDEYARFLRDNYWCGELELRRKDGSLVPVEARATSVIFPHGIVYVSIIRDISARKEAEEHLREDARIVETLHRIGATLTAELDLETVVQAVTDAATEVTGAQFGAFFYNVANEGSESYMLYTLSGVPREAFAGYPMPRNTALFGPTFRGEDPIRLDDITRDPRYAQNPPYEGMPPGHLPVRSYLAIPVISRSGEVLGGLFFGHEEVGAFTQRDERLATGIAAQAAIAIDNARLYQQAQKAIETRDVFLSIASHELRTPLAVLKGYAELTERRAMSAGNVSARELKAVRIIHEQAGRLQRLIGLLLDFSRIQTGQLSIEHAPVNLNALAQRVVETLQPTAEQHTLELRVPDKTLVVKGDELRLEQALHNLVENAVKYSPKGGPISVVVERREDQAALAVADQGMGIPAEALTGLFTRFYRASNVGASGISGMGLGLYIVKQVVGLHGGTVEVTSKEGEGSCFTVLLPVNGAET